MELILHRQQPRAGTMDNQAQFTFACPHCGQQLEAEQDMAGMELECPSCGKPLQVPSASPEAKSEPPKLRAVPQTEEATSTTRSFADQAKTFAGSAATSVGNAASPILHRLKTKWNTLDNTQRKGMTIMIASIAAVFVLLSCFTRACSSIRAKRREREAIRAAKASVERLAFEEAERRKEKQEERRRRLEEQKEEARIAEEEHRKKEEEHRREEARLLMERDAATQKGKEERYAREILSPLGLKSADFGWKTIPDSPKTDFAIAAKAALVEQSRGNWLEMAFCLSSLDRIQRGTYVDPNDARRTVDLAKTVIERVQHRARMTERCLSPDYCHLEPKVHVQKSIKGKVSVSLKGKYYEDCVKKQHEGDWLGLINALRLHRGQDRKAEAFYYTNETFDFDDERGARNCFFYT